LFKITKSLFIFDSFILLKIVEFLTDSEDKTRFEERQQALLDLIQADNKLNLDDDKLLRMAEKAKL
jgi:hypothetical protein